MGRPKKPLSSTTEAAITKGLSLPQVVAKARRAGDDASERTLARRLRESKETRRGARPPRAPAAPPAAWVPPADDVPESPDAIPADASLSTLRAWLERVERMVIIAEADEDLAQIGNMGRLAVALDAAIRKATPEAPPDPNDNPDMVKLGAEVAARLHKLVDLAAGPA